MPRNILSEVSIRVSGGLSRFGSHPATDSALFSVPAETDGVIEITMCRTDDGNVSVHVALVGSQQRLSDALVTALRSWFCATINMVPDTINSANGVVTFDARALRG